VLAAGAGNALDVEAFQVALGGPRYSKPAEVKTFYRALYDRLRQVDGVKSAGLTSHLPMVDFGYNGYFRIEGETPWRPNAAPLVEYRWLYGDYLKTLGVPLLQGRLLGDVLRLGIGPWSSPKRCRRRDVLTNANHFARIEWCL
jgi:hypothetical protein